MTLSGRAAATFAVALAIGGVHALPGDAAAAAVGDEPTPTWSDEFEGPPGAPPDPNVWKIRTGGRWRTAGRLELACYTKRAENVSQDGLGHLRIAAYYDPGNTYCANGPNDYTSARLDSRLLKTFQYGRIEARVKLPTAAGSWPALSLVGFPGTWPSAGEVEIVQSRPGAAPDQLSLGLNADTGSGAFWAQRFDVPAPLSTWGDWHTYGIDWRQDQIDFQIDGVTQWTRSPADLREGDKWEFNNTFGLLLNVAVGSLGGTPDPAQYPAEMLVDWVRVYPPTPETPPTPPPSSDPVVAVAGDVATSNGRSERTAKILDELGMDAVLLPGDGAYPDGSEQNYTDYFEPTWGRHKSQIYPVPGNHEYHILDAEGFFNYFGSRAGPRAKGWYSFDLGSWHVIGLNSSGGCNPVLCGPDSEQYQWLREDLAAHPSGCTLAFWHHPRWSEGAYKPGSSAVAPLWDLLYDQGVALIVNGHDHNYQRFAPLDKTGAPDPDNGMREFVVGTGGNVMYPVGAPDGRLEASETGTLGVFKLTLHETGYDWQFVPEAGGSYSDGGNGSCR
jgi:beta-glucanase (GH16 family)